MSKDDEIIIKDFISHKMIELRKLAGWSQSELARRAGVTSPAINQIEKGDRMPSLILILKVARAFKVSLLELIGENEVVIDKFVCSGCKKEFPIETIEFVSRDYRFLGFLCNKCKDRFEKEENSETQV